MNFDAYIRINSSFQLMFSERILKPTKDIFYSNGKMNMPNEILGIDIDQSDLFDDKRIYLIALLKNKIEEILDKKCKYDRFVLTNDDFDLFFYINEQDKQLLKTWAYQEQIHNIVKIY